MRLLKLLLLLLLLLIIIIIIIFLETEEGWKKHWCERETLINCLPYALLIRDWTCNLGMCPDFLVCGTTFQPTEPLSQGVKWILVKDFLNALWTSQIPYISPRRTDLEQGLCVRVPQITLRPNDSLGELTGPRSYYTLQLLFITVKG